MGRTRKKLVPHIGISHQEGMFTYIGAQYFTIRVKLQYLHPMIPNIVKRIGKKNRNATTRTYSCTTADAMNTTTVAKLRLLVT